MDALILCLGGCLGQSCGLTTRLGFSACKLCWGWAGVCSCMVLCVFLSCVLALGLVKCWLDVWLILCLGFGWARVAVKQKVRAFLLQTLFGFGWGVFMYGFVYVFPLCWPWVWSSVGWMYGLILC